MADALSILSIISFVVAGICFAVSIFVWFKFKIPSIIGDLSGRTARKSIEKMRANNEKSGDKSYRSSMVNKNRGKLTDTIQKKGLDTSKASNKQNIKNQNIINKKNNNERTEEAAHLKVESEETAPLNIGSEETAPLIEDAETTASLNEETERLNEETTSLVEGSEETAPLAEESGETAPLAEESGETAPLVEEPEETSPLVEELGETSPLIEKSEETSLLSQESEETELLVDNQNSNVVSNVNGKTLTIIDDIMLIHTDEVIP